MDYTLDETYEYILDRADKKGSDMFQLPYVLNVFQTQTYDFIDEQLPYLESNQRNTQDLQQVMLTKKINVVNDPQDNFKTNAALPEDLYHLSRVNPIFKGGVTSRRPKLIRHGNYDGMRTDPHNKPTAEYPLITQYNNYINIDSGFNEKPISTHITYLTKPIFAKENELQERIVNLPNGVIEAIIQKCVKELVSSKGDQRTQAEFAKEAGARTKRQ
tara:strand:- start:61546 stop:62193 length:648 start_codon:yes stop_codon:yes gene_type:complete